MSKLKLNTFLKDDSGSLSVEAVLVAPLIFLGLTMTFTFFSAFQAKAAANKAAYTVSDYISRQTETLDADFMEGLGDIYGFLTRNSDDSMRVSSVKWIKDVDTDEGEYYLEWSYAVNGDTALTDVTLSSVEDRLPLLSSGETILLVETDTSWTPIFDVGLDAFTFTDIITTKPRFATQVVFDTGSLGSASASDSIYDDEEGEAYIEP
jgi:hypothetical protein